MVAVFVAPSVSLVAPVVRLDTLHHTIPVLLSDDGATRLYRLLLDPVFLQAITPPSAGSPIAVVVFNCKFCVPMADVAVHSVPLLQSIRTQQKLGLVPQEPVKFACGVLLLVLLTNIATEFMVDMVKGMLLPAL